MLRSILIFLTIIALLLLAIYCSKHHGKHIEQDITSRIQADTNIAQYNLENIAISGRDITLNGTVKSDEIKENIEKSIQNVWGVRTVTNNLQVIKMQTPYLFNLNYDGNNIHFSGYLNDHNAHNNFKEQVAHAFAENTISNDIKIVGGAPSGWHNVVFSSILPHVKMFNEVNFQLKDNSLFVKGVVFDKKQKHLVENSLANLTNIDYVLSYDISIPEAERPIEKPTAQPIEEEKATQALVDACQSELNEMLAQEKIYFETANTSIDLKASKVLLDIVDIAKKCENTLIEIAGHTDADGSAISNLKLSNGRALSVKNFLISKGVDGNRLTAIGYGESTPIADNNTAEGKATNRRIDFTVTPIKETITEAEEE